MKKVIEHAKIWLSLKSKTLNFSLLLQLMAIVQVYVDGIGNPLATVAVAVIVALLRFKTTQSVHTK